MIMSEWGFYVALNILSPIKAHQNVTENWKASFFGENVTLKSETFLYKMKEHLERIKKNMLSWLKWPLWTQAWARRLRLK